MSVCVCVCVCVIFSRFSFMYFFYIYKYCWFLDIAYHSIQGSRPKEARTVVIG